MILDPGAHIDPEGHIDSDAAIGVLGLLAGALFERFTLQRNLVDLDDTCLHLTTALSLSPNDALRAPILAKLGTGVSTRFDMIGRMSDLDKAIQYHRQSLRLVGIEKLPSWCGTDIVQEVIDIGDQARKPLPDGHPSLVGIEHNLAFLHLHTAEPMLERAFFLFRQAVGEETGSAKERLSVAVDWSSCARSYGHPSTEDAYSHAMQQLNRCLVAYSTVDSQHEFLARPLTCIECSNLIADAASFAIQNEHYNKAVEIIEQGRTFIWSRMRRYHHPLDQLRRADSIRAAEFQRLSGDIERFAVTFESGSFSIPFSGTLSAHISFTPTRSPFHWHRELAEEWRNKLDNIRANVPGFRDFLQPLPFLRLWRAAVDGPVIIINHSSHRSDALVIIKKSQTVLCVPLPGDLDALWRLQESIGTHTYLYRSSTQMRIFGVREGVNRTENNTVYVLRGVWRGIVEPIVTLLRSHGVPEMSRIWWCPTGMLGILPIHAAGPYSPGSGKDVPDIYISSYTPTLSVLITAREVLKGADDHTPNLLFVGVSSSPRFTSLPSVRVECDVTRTFVPQGKTLLDEKVRSKNVLAELPNHSWVHFASHAAHSIDQPFDSSIILYDEEEFQLREFMMAHSTHARLAILSACDSAALSKSTPDEVLHLSAAI
ncbi:CHAT domain-containing protein [Mycena maculata]|uniref:CHAT domain-containing protein n=1 Tax=Mycena maculata TaxID=230809 RepID=A0AAD7NBH4_9AGAR|nr:CHAT domain-containing protein [Mycena maculata]